MEREYIPLYFGGEILVSFYDSPVNDFFASRVGSTLGYQLQGRWLLCDDVFMYQTKCGEENKACAEFRSQEEVAWAERRDFSVEGRKISLTRTMRELEQLQDRCGTMHLSDYLSEIERIKKGLR